MVSASVHGLHAWAMVEQKDGRWAKARTLLERAQMLQPGNAVVLQSRALLEARAHNYEEARGFFQEAVQAAPRDAACWQVGGGGDVLVCRGSRM